MNADFRAFMCLIVSLYLPVGTCRDVFLFERLSVILVPSVKPFSKVSFRMPVCSILSWISSSVGAGGGVERSHIPVAVMQCRPKKTQAAVSRNCLRYWAIRQVFWIDVEMVSLFFDGFHSVQG